MKENNYKKSWERLLPILMIASFILLGVISMYSIYRMQGNARVINYSGLIRGATQRLVKQEMNGQKNDKLVDELDQILLGLARQDNIYGLEGFEVLEFQQCIIPMQRVWEDLKDEIQKVRKGGDSRRLYELSEEYFVLADNAVSEAEHYSEKMVNNNILWLVLLDGSFGLFSVVFLLYRKQQEKTQKKLKAAEDASREKGEFLSRMSHEIRTPMNGIIGMTELARLSLGDKKKTEDCLNKIKLSSDYLLSLINDILDMSRIESGKVDLCQEVFSLEDFIARLRTMFEHKAISEHLTFEIKSNVIAPGVIGDEIRLSQVVVNIISNAIKFTQPGGSVLVNLTQSLITNQQCRLHISVEDTGIGISKEAMERIFEPFEQAEGSISRQYGGSGLGLAISSNLMRMMGGSLQVSSTPGKGSKFTAAVTLPLPDNQLILSADSKPAQLIQNYDLSGYRILLAEDNELNAEIAISLLRMKGADIDHAWNGKEVLGRFMESEPGYYRFILMDIQMPEISGLEACKLIRKCGHPQAESILILGLSANAFREDEDRALEAGMNGYLLKPFSMNDLAKALQANIDVV